MPCRQPAEGLCVAHREEVSDPIGCACRIGANALGNRRVDMRDLLLPFVRLTHGLIEVVVDDGATSCFGEPAHQAVLHLRAVATATLDYAGAEFAQHVTQREHLLLIGPQRRKMYALRVIVALVARDRKAESTSLHTVPYDVPHRFDFGVGDRKSTR